MWSTPQISVKNKFSPKAKYTTYKLLRTAVDFILIKTKTLSECDR